MTDAGTSNSLRYGYPSARGCGNQNRLDYFHGKIQRIDWQRQAPIRRSGAVLRRVRISPISMYGGVRVVGGKYQRDSSALAEFAD